MNFKEKVEELVQAALDENPSLFLIDLTVGGDNSIRVLLDGDQGVTLEACMQVSRKVEHNLDREETDFSIEVSSCGVGSPLNLPRQFKKNVTRKLEVVDMEDKQVQGTLIEATDTSFILQWKAREPKPIGKGKVTVTKTKEFQYGQYKSAKVIIAI
ncbi:MAG: ribosome assembly cofactor RimP [Flavobacteriaceae bacterium]